MNTILDFGASLLRREFLIGMLTGVVCGLVALAGLRELGVLRSESEDLLLSADYRLSRTEAELREEVRNLKSQLEMLRRARPISAPLPGQGDNDPAS